MLKKTIEIFARWLKVQIPPRSLATFTSTREYETRD